MNVPKILSSTGTVDFDGNKITTTNEIIAGKVTTPKIWSASGLIDFDGCNLKTTAGITGASLLISGNSTLSSLIANSFQNPLFAGVTNGLILSDANGSFQKLDFNGNQNSYLRGDGTFGSLSGTSTWDTIYANAIIGGYVNATKSIQLDGSITAGSRGTGTIGEYSIVVGGPEPMYGYTTSPVASGKYSVSFGTANESSNLGSMSFGGGNISSGLFSFAIGGNNISSGNLSVAIGSNNTASGGNSTVIGYNNIAEGKQSAIIGGTGNTLTVDAINSAIIGGTGITATQANSVYVPNLISTGNVGIGVESPIEKLDVAGNANIRGYLYVQDGVIIGKRITSEKVTSDIISTSKLEAIEKISTKEFEGKTLLVEKVTADTLKTENMTLLLMQADSITAQKMTLDKLAINDIKAVNEITSREIKIGEQAKIGNNIIIDGLTNNISTPGSITAGNITAGTMNVTNQSITNLNVSGGIKVGNSSIIIGDFTETGTDNNIYTENSDLFIQSFASSINNTIINNNDGNVGIGTGTNTPYKKLTVNGDVSFANYFSGGTDENPGNGMSAFEILGNNQIPTRRGISLDSDPNGNLNFWIHTWQSSAFNFMRKDNDNTTPDATNLMTILKNGDIGIGTDDPKKRLHVKTKVAGSTGAGQYLGSIRVENEVVNLGTTSTWDLEPIVENNETGLYTRFSIGTPENTGMFTIKENGNVGIGINDPNAKLDVAGDIRINNNDIFFRDYASNGNHGLGWYGDASQYGGPVKMFADKNIDGPVLYGFNGGALASNQWGSTNIALRWLSNGKIGIGTDVPSEKVHIKNGSMYIEGEGCGLIVNEGGHKRVGFMKYYNHEAGIWRVANQDFEIGRLDVTMLPGTPTTFTTDLYIADNGNVGIGTSNTFGYKFAVNGNIIAEGIRIRSYGNWSDFVFSDTYKLRSIEELSIFIKKYKHLPDVPSAEDVQKNGIDIANMNSILLQKIEELSLHIIDLNNEMKVMKCKLETLKK